MSLDQFLEQLDELGRQACDSFDASSDDDALEAARIEYLGAKSGKLKSVQKKMGAVDKADKPAAGKRLNEVKRQIQEAFETAQQRLEGAGASGGAADQFDATLPLPATAVESKLSASPMSMAHAPPASYGQTVICSTAKAHDLFRQRDSLHAARRRCTHRPGRCVLPLRRL